MLKNYLKVAFRSLTRHKFFSFINIIGLAISMSVCLGIIMLIADQMMYDRYNTKRDRIYRVVTQYLNPQGVITGNDMATSPAPLAPTLLENYTGVEKVVRLRRGFGNGWLEEFEQNVNVPLAGFFADPEVLDFFELELEYGNAATALTTPYSVVLTKKASRKLFKQENPVGEVIKVGDLGEYKVTGVIRETSHKSHIIYEAFASFSTIQSLEAIGKLSKKDSEWENYFMGWTYILLEKGRKPYEIENHLAKIAGMNKPRLRNGNEQGAYRFYLQNISAITPGPFLNNPIGPFMPMIFIYFFGGLALIVMLTSCFNYTNLSIARSLTRAREIGVRKVNGAFRYQIFTQFLSESVLIAFFSLALSMVFLFLVKPFILNLKFAQMLKWDLEGNLMVYSAFILFTLMIGIMAGFFPAVILSKFEPIKVLKNAGKNLKLFSRMGLRKSLLVIQFSLSLIFIISVLLLYNQLALFIKADHGFDMANKINLRFGNTPYAVLQNDLATYSNIENVAAASHVPAAGITFGDSFKKALHEEDPTNVDYFLVDHNYIDNMSLSLVAGKNFDPDAGKANKNFMIINEKAVEKFLFDSPHNALGQYLYNTTDSSKYEIIGVVKTYNHEALITQPGPMALLYDSARFGMLQVKYTGSREDAVKTIEAVWARHNPTLKIDYRDMDVEVLSFYEMVFSDFVKIVGIISFMAIAISCLGLLGMATYATETRLKEIAIRKVLGSNDAALVILISKSFVTLLVIAIVLAVPVAYFVNNAWLQLIAYRTNLGVGVISLGVLILIVLGIITIGSQTLRAAYTNPVKSLKNE